MSFSRVASVLFTLLDVDCDDAPFELTELDHLALAKDYARALALADAQAQAPDAHTLDDSDDDVVRDR